MDIGTYNSRCFAEVQIQKTSRPHKRDFGTIDCNWKSNLNSELAPIRLQILNPKTKFSQANPGVEVKPGDFYKICKIQANLKKKLESFPLETLKTTTCPGEWRESVYTLHRQHVSGNGSVKLLGTSRFLERFATSSTEQLTLLATEDSASAKVRYGTVRCKSVLRNWDPVKRYLVKPHFLRTQWLDPNKPEDLNALMEPLLLRFESYSLNLMGKYFSRYPSSYNANYHLNEKEANILICWYTNQNNNPRNTGSIKSSFIMPLSYFLATYWMLFRLQTFACDNWTDQIFKGTIHEAFIRL